MIDNGFVHSGDAAERRSSVSLLMRISVCIDEDLGVRTHDICACLLLFHAARSTRRDDSAFLETPQLLWCIWGSLRDVAPTVVCHRKGMGTITYEQQSVTFTLLISY